GDVPASEGPKVLAQLNQWNTEHFAPTLRFFETGEGSLAVSAVRELNISQGLSRNQVGAFVMSTLDAVVQSFTWLEQQYPELV
ncbi:YbjN domain-containing protein, partial [Klebsiella pneumoniae]|nr:YbjN domain-containing protein [Klebsiella pneumoniae]